MIIERMATDYILRRWKEKPNRPRRTYTAIGWLANGENPLLPLTREEVRDYKAFLKKRCPKPYAAIFPEESDPPQNNEPN